MRIDPEKIRATLTSRNRENEEKPHVSELLYRVPPFLKGKVAPRSTVESLATFPLFQDLAKKELSLLANFMHKRAFEDGESVFDQGSPAAAMYLIRSGCIELSRKMGGTDVVLASLSPGEFLGEIALLQEDALRWITARSRGRSELLALSRPDFETLIARSPAVGMKLLTVLARLTSQRFVMLLEAANGGSEK
jgi:CRP-like cAMP-binding protein